jgi:hypothetical protein
MTQTETQPVQWRVDASGFLLTPSGAKAARVADGTLYLWDKRSKCERAFTMEDWLSVDGAVTGNGPIAREKEIVA